MGKNRLKNYQKVRSFTILESVFEDFTHDSSKKSIIQKNLILRIQNRLSWERAKTFLPIFKHRRVLGFFHSSGARKELNFVLCLSFLVVFTSSFILCYHSAGQGRFTGVFLQKILVKKWSKIGQKFADFGDFLR